MNLIIGMLICTLRRYYQNFTISRSNYSFVIPTNRKYPSVDVDGGKSGLLLWPDHIFPKVHDIIFFFCSSEATSRGLLAGSAKSPSGIAELLLSPHDAGPVIPKTPSLPPLPTGASQLTPPQSPLAADAGKGRQLTPKQPPIVGRSTHHRPGDGRQIRRQLK